MSVLVVAAHPDDEILGCGGTISKLSKEGYQVNILFISDGESSRKIKTDEIKKRIKKRYSDAKKANKIIGSNELFFLSFPDNQLDTIPRLKIIKKIEDIIIKTKPHTVFTHSNSDVNIDHRIVHESVLVACRPKPASIIKKLLFYEIPSSTEWSTPNSFMTFTPNYFYDISNTIKTKLKAFEAYENEIEKYPHPRSIKAIKALSEWRGASAGLLAAEAFSIGRIIKK